MANREIVQKNQQIKPFLNKKRIQSSLSIIIIIGMFLGFLSPFGMSDISLVWSIFFWLVACTAGFLIYMPIIYYGDLILVKILPMHWGRVAISALLASTLMSFVIPLLNWLFFSTTVNYGSQFFSFFPKTIVIGGLITFISMMQDYIKWQKDELIEQQKINEEYQGKATQEANQPIAKFMALLPVIKRGELICLEMADHYVKVYTNKGHHLLLMRFKDALELLSDYQGLQTHRSWWVAKTAIVALNKEGRKVTLTLTNELEVPVSRTYSDDVKSANLH